MANTRRPRNDDLRAALAKKSHRTDSFDLQMDDDAPAALDAFRRAVQYDDVAKMGDDTALQAKTGQARKNAEADYLRHVHRFALHSISPTDYVALEAEYPKSAEEDANLYDQPFYFHLLAACADSDLTADEWRATLMDGQFDVGEVNDLLSKVGLLNVRFASGEIPKG
jgi:hypothetical protein